MFVQTPHSSTKNTAEIIHSNSWHTWLLIPNMMMSWITSWAIFSAHFTFQEAFWHHTRRIFCYNTASLSRVLSCSFESGIFHHSDHTTFPPGDRPPGAICAASNNNRVWLINVSIVRRLRFNYFSHKTPALWIISFFIILCEATTWCWISTSKTSPSDAMSRCNESSSTPSRLSSLTLVSAVPTFPVHSFARVWFNIQLSKAS